MLSSWATRGRLCLSAHELIKTRNTLLCRTDAVPVPTISLVARLGSNLYLALRQLL